MASSREPRPKLPAAGALVAVPLPNGRLGAIRIMTGDAFVRFLVLDRFWNELPSAAAVADGRFMAAPFGQGPGLHEDVFKGTFRAPMPSDFAVVGEDLSLAFATHAGHEGTMVFQDGEHFRRTLHQQWRWLHDRDALQREWQEAAAKREAAAAAKRERRKRLPLKQFAAERPFASWNERCSPRVVPEVHRIFRDVAIELDALAGKRIQATKLALLQRITTELNALDDGEGFIETVEREALVARIEELAALVGLDNEDELLTRHRDW